MKICQLIATTGLLLLPSSAWSEQNLDLDKIKQRFPELYQQLLAANDCIADDSKCDAVSGETKPDAPAKTAKPKPHGHGQWWQASSFSDPDKSLKQALSAQVSFKFEHGNEDDEEFTLQGEYYLRTGQWTPFLALTYFKEQLKQNGNTTRDIEYYMANGGFKYDFSPMWYNETGFVVERDTSSSIDQRKIFYAGLGSYLYDKPHLTLSATLTLGHVDDTFLGEIESLLDLNEQDYSIAYLYQKLTWQPLEMVRLTQTLRLLNSFEKLPLYQQTAGDNAFCEQTIPNVTAFCIAEDDRRQQITLGLKLEYMVNQHLSFAYDYNLTHDTLPWPGVASTDVLHNVGVRFQF